MMQNIENKQDTNEHLLDKLSVGGQILHEGDRVFTHGFTDNGWGRHYGTLHRNTEFPEVSDWWIEYDDKEQFAVLDFADVFKA